MSDPYRPSRYRAYLLRCWQERREHADLPGTWRFSLEDPHTGQRRGFADLEALVGFLRQDMRCEESRLEKPRGTRSKDTHTELP